MPLNTQTNETMQYSTVWLTFQVYAMKRKKLDRNTWLYSSTLSSVNDQRFFCRLFTQFLYFSLLHILFVMQHYRLPFHLHEQRLTELNITYYVSGLFHVRVSPDTMSMKAVSASDGVSIRTWTGHVEVLVTSCILEASGYNVCLWNWINNLQAERVWENLCKNLLLGSRTQLNKN